MTPQLPITPDKLAAYAGTLREKEGVRNAVGAISTSTKGVPDRPSNNKLLGDSNSTDENQATRRTNSRPEPRGTPQQQATSTNNAKQQVNPTASPTSAAIRNNANRPTNGKALQGVTPTQHFPLIPEPKHPAPTYSEDARLTTLGTMALFQLWQAPNNMKDIEQLAAYFSVPPTVIHRELQELDLIPEEFSGEKITVEWMLKDARTQRERQREARERFLRDNEGRDVEGMYQFEEWRITTPHSSPIPINEFVLDPGHPEARPVPDNYLAAEDEVRAQEIERVIDAGEAANASARNRGRRNRV